MIKILNFHENLGSVYQCRCPDCDQEASFDLNRDVAHFTLFRLPVLRIKDLYRLSCASCEKLYELTDGEVSELLKLQALLKSELELLDDEAKPSLSLLEMVSELSITSIDSLRMINNTWDCEACHESVPGNMPICWNCGHETDDERVQEVKGKDLEFVNNPFFGTQVRVTK